MKDTIATVIVDLKPSEEEIFKSLQKDGRYGINRAIKEGLKAISVEENIAVWEEYWRLYAHSMDRVDVEPMSFDDLLDTQEELFVCIKYPEDKFKQSWEHGKIIAGATLKIAKDVFAYEGNVITLGTNASLEEYRNLQPNNLLYWKCICWAKEHGYEFLDLGGWQINARDNAIGVNKFKERFGKIVYYEKDFSFLKAIGRKLIRNYSLFWNFNKWLRGRK
jgi:lipid II:glycine glycyltransferase (peptidoglycan interpeptide bridge formation enzyme)